MKILIVLTSHDELGDTGRKTGFWLEELATPYYHFRDAGWDITLASPRGGRPPLDPKSNEPYYQTDQTRRFEADDDAEQQLSATVRLDSVSVGDYDAVFYPGGHGPLWDLAEDLTSIALIEHMVTARRPLALVCHAPGTMRHATALDGSPLAANLQITGFTDSEEEAMGLTRVVPFLVEDELVAQGAVFSRVRDFKPLVVVDGMLITGQNPASSGLAAMELISLVRNTGG
jgi:putative intracellular protease/amidase